MQGSAPLPPESTCEVDGLNAPVLFVPVGSMPLHPPRECFSMVPRCSFVRAAGATGALRQLWAIQSASRAGDREFFDARAPAVGRKWPSDGACFAPGKKRSSTQ